MDKHEARLIDTLYAAACVLTEQLPHELQEAGQTLLCTFSHAQVDEACTLLIEAALEYPKLDPDFAGYAFCPLCGGGTTAGRAWQVSDGLWRHLHGYQRSRKCRVVLALCGSAHYQVNQLNAEPIGVLFDRPAPK